MTDIFDLLADTQEILRNAAAGRGVAGMLMDEGAFTAQRLFRPGKHPSAWYVTCHAMTRTGLHVPIQETITIGDDGSQLTAGALAAAVLDTLVALRDAAPRHALLKASIEKAALEEVERADAQGVRLRLVSIVEWAIRPTEIEDRSDLAFDVVMEMLNAKDLLPDVYSMRANDAAEFRSYLRHTIVPGQAELAARRAVDAPRLAANG